MDSANQHSRHHPRRVATRFCLAIAGLIVLAITVIAPQQSAWGHQAEPPKEAARRQLAARYAPIIATAQQQEPCGAGEAFRPVPVEAVLARQGVVLRHGDGEVVMKRPESEDLFGLSDDHWLDLPGRALRPGCDYEQWLNASDSELLTTAYARVSTEAGRPGWLALQYWLFFPFNDWNNRHEGDWEMIQLLFDVETAAAALNTEPVAVGYAQHTGAERSAWSDDKLHRDGTHPIVFTATGSHASYFDEAVHLGHSGTEGFGCDDTTGVKTTEIAEVVMLPDAVEDPSDPMAWLEFEGSWGERNSGPNDGPTGPKSRPRFEGPISWADEEWRATSLEVPSTRDGVSRATDFFCSSVGAGSRLYLTYLRTPWLALAALGITTAGAVALGRRTRWGPVRTTVVEKPQPAGALLRTSVAIYRREAQAMTMLGLAFVPVGIATSLMVTAVLQWTRLNRFLAFTVEDPLVGVMFFLLFGSIGTVIGTVVVQAGATHAVEQLLENGEVDIVDCFREVLARGWTLGRCTLRITSVVALGGLTVIGLPLVLIYLARRSLFIQAVMFERLSQRTAFKRSSQLVRETGWSVVLVVAIINVVAVATGPVVGAAMVLIDPISLRFANVIAGLMYAIAMPWAGVASALVFLSARADAMRRSDHPRGVKPTHPPTVNDRGEGEPDGSNRQRNNSHDRS